MSSAPGLRAHAQTPKISLPTPPPPQKPRQARPQDWLGATLKSISGLDEMGVAVVSIPPDSAAAKLGLQEGDVILHLAGWEINTPVQVSAAYIRIDPG